MRQHDLDGTDFYYRGWTGEPPPEPDPDPDPEPDPDPDLPVDPDPQREDSLWGHSMPGGHGLILGRFMPPHLGHDTLIRVAKRHVSELTVIVAARTTDPIEIPKRLAWLGEMHPDIDVRGLDVDRLPELDAHNYWQDLAAAVRRTLRGRGVDALFASEPSAQPLARLLRAELCLVDPERERVPVSATMIRRDPLTHWEYLPECVRPYFVRRICLLGPEGCGKSTLARQLADHYDTRCVEEVAREYARRRDQQLGVADFEAIARRQVMMEDAERQHANRRLFCDTELLSLALWCERLHGESPKWIREAAHQRTDTVYLLCAPDLPYPGEPRFGGEPARRRFFERCLQEVRGRWPFAVVRGRGESRLQNAMEALDTLAEQSMPRLGVRDERCRERGELQ